MREFAERPRHHSRGRREAQLPRNADARDLCTTRASRPADSREIAFPAHGRTRSRHDRDSAGATFSQVDVSRCSASAAANRSQSRIAPARGRPRSAPAARTIAPPCCSKGRSPAAASAATPWPCASTTPRAPFRSSRTWAARARPGSAWRRSSISKHIFQNIGDGTLFHSGYLAIEACVAAEVNITYKILYNGHVAMTGGQDAVGALPIPRSHAQAASRGRAQNRRAGRRHWRNTPSAGELASNAELRDRATNCRARCAELEEDPRRDGHDLRPGVRRRKAPQALARDLRRAHQAPGDQRRSLRRLRRLREAVQLHEPDAGDDRARPEDAHSPVVLQQGLFLRARRLPVVCHRRAQAGHRLCKKQALPQLPADCSSAAARVW